MKNKGFTLIELLAVIVILAVIALIATPLIMGTITKAKKNAFIDTANGILKSAENYQAEKLATTKGDVSNLVIPDIGKDEKLQYKGNKPQAGYLTVTSDGKTSIAIWSGQFCALKHLYDSKVTVDESIKTKDNCISEVIEAGEFATDSWQTIATVVKKNPRSYPLGAKKQVTLTGDYAGTYTVRVVNNTSPAECSQAGFSQTACGFVVEFTDIITDLQLNSIDTNQGGWANSQLHRIVNTNIYNSFPQNLKNVIKDTKVVSSYGGADSSNLISSDKLYLLSTKEVWGKEGTTEQ